MQDGLQGSQSDLAEQTQRLERQSRDTDSLLQTLQRRLGELTSSAGAGPSRAQAHDIPVGLGLEGYFPTDEVHWVEPLDAPPPDANGKRVFPPRVESLSGVVGSEPPPRDAKKLKPEPVYTVPRNATLVGARGFTALVGRIPVGGQVVDPFPFKVLVGADNLAANGVVMPELFGMVFSGRAVGDWTLGVRSRRAL